MKRLVYILLLMMAAGTVACQRTPGEAERRLIDIDSLIASAPDSALTLLAALSPSPNPQPAGTSEPSGTSEASGASGDSSPSKLEGARGSVLESVGARDSSPSKLEGARGSVSASDEASPVRMTAGERAYHALLTAQAMYKAYIPATTDSVINVAWDYYGHLGMFASATDRQRRVRAMLYKGTTAEELGHPDSAMYWYKRTELEAAPDDHYHRGYALMSMGILYQGVYSYRQAINKYRQVLHDSSYVDLQIRKFCILQLSQLYNVNKLDSTYYYLNRLKACLDATSSDSYYDHAYHEGLVYYNYYKGNYDACKIIGSYLIKEDSVLANCSCWQAVSISYSKLNYRDSALYYHINSPLPANLDDSVWYNQSEAELRLLNNDIQNSVKYENFADDLAGNKVISSIENGLTNIEYKTEIEYNLSSHNDEVTFLIIVAAIIILTLLLLYFYKSIRRQGELQSLYKFIDDLENQVSSSEILATKLNSTKDQLNRSNVDLERMRESIDLITDALRTILTIFQHSHYKQKSESNHILDDVLSEEFFAHLRLFIDYTHHDLASSMSENEKLSVQDINIVCMHICKIPNTIISHYAGYANVHSVTTRKDRIVKTFLGTNAHISDIMNY